MRSTVATFVTHAAAALAVATSLGLAPAARAQSVASPDAVPRKVVTAILNTDARMGGAGAPQLQIGGAPSVVTAEIDLPPGSELLGSLTYGQTSDLLAIVPLSPDSARVTIERAMIAKGWRHPLSPQQRTGGLLYGQISASPMRMLCKGSDAYAVVTAAVHSGPTRGSDVRVSLVNGDSPCAMLDRAQQQITQVYVNPFSTVPPLYPPTGFSMSRCGTNGGQGDATMSQTYSSSLEPTEVLNHYGRQFEAAGWHSAGIPNVRLGTWTVTDSTGKARSASLSVTPVPGQKDCYAVQLSVSRN